MLCYFTAAVPVGVAFRDLKRVGTRDPTSFGAQWLAYTLPCGRFAVTRAGANARLGAEVVSLRLSRGGLAPPTPLSPNATPYWMTGGSGAEVERFGVLGPSQ